VLNRWIVFVAAASAAVAPALAGDCPAAVKAAALEGRAGASIASCKAETEKGKTQYEVKVALRDKRTLEIDVTPDGKVLKTEEKIAVSEAPAAVAAGLRAKYRDAKIEGVERQELADGSVQFEVKFRAGKTVKEATFDALGKLLEEE